MCFIGEVAAKVQSRNTPNVSHLSVAAGFCGSFSNDRSKIKRGTVQCSLLYAARCPLIIAAHAKVSSGGFMSLHGLRFVIRVNAEGQGKAYRDCCVSPQIDFISDLYFSA